MELRFPDGSAMALDRPRVAGILNVTPDSFSDGGAYVDADAAVAHALEMVRQGATILDIGGESTRPGSQRVSAAEQKRRVVEVIRRVREELAKPRAPQGAPGETVQISIDTTLSEVAAAALEAGAGMLNDVAAGREDAGMFALAAERGAPIILMHMLGQPATMQQDPRYDDVVREVHGFLLERAAAAEAAGVPRPQIVLDPGIGFGKTVEHNLKLLAALPELVALGYPVMLGASRKRFLATVAGSTGDAATDRLAGTVATTAWAAACGVHLVRVHDVRPNVEAAAVATAIRQASGL